MAGVWLAAGVMTLPLDLQTPVAGTAPALATGQGTGTAGKPNQAASTEGSGETVSIIPVVPVLEIHVVGVPTPQGSKRGFVNKRTGRVNIVDDNKPRLRTWRDDVKNAAIDARDEWRAGWGNDHWTALAGPVELDITFLMPRPKGHYRTGRNAHQLRDSAPSRPITKPDCDKLLRGCCDSLKDAGIYRDDAQVVSLTGRKVYATSHTGAVINLYAGQA